MLDDWVITAFESGLRNVRAHQIIDQLRHDLALTNFLLEIAEDEALSAHREIEKLTYELGRRKAHRHDIVETAGEVQPPLRCSDRCCPTCPRQ